MERTWIIIVITCIVFALQSVHAQSSSRLPPSQIHSLVRLQKLLEYPSALNEAFNNTQNVDLCSRVPSPGFNISCNYTQSGSQTVVVLQIFGKNSNSSSSSSSSSSNKQQLSSNFSMETLGNLLSALPDLRILGLVHLGIWGQIPAKLDHLQQLQALNLSGNSIWGAIPDRLAALNRLQTLQLSDNKLNGSVPAWLGELQNLRDLDLSHNNLTGSLPRSLFTGKKNKLERLSISHNGLSGSLPEVSSDSHLGYLNAGANHLGPDFPKLGYGGNPSGIRFLLLGQNDFEAPIPQSIAAKLRHVQVLDLSYNALSGTPPVDLFRLSAIETLALNGNQLQGVLPSNLSLSPSLRFLDLSSNFFTGRLPDSFLAKNSANRTLTVRFGKNCFSTRAQRQYPRSHCENRKSPVSRFADSHDLAIIAGIIGGGIALLGAVVVFLCVLLRCLRQHKQHDKPAPYAASSCADTASLGVPSDLLSNARYLSQSIRLGVHAASHNRVFSVPELEEATANFSSANLIGEGQHGKVYRGKLQDGCVVAVKCLTLDPRQDLRQLKAHVELLVKIRHRHLVGYIGYSLDSESEGSAQNRARRLFLVSEYVDNGTLRNHISKSDGKELLNWPQRLAAVIGAGRGIQYLHTGVVPGIFNNDVNITNILMDQNCVAKFTDFGLGRHARTSSDFDAKVYVQKTPAHIDLDHHRRKLASDKTDVYNFGFILLEIVLGRPPTIDDPKALHPKVRELEMLLTENVPRFEVVDSSIVGTCVAESLNTVLEIAAKCLSEEPPNRPSMEDVLWNLQYAAQVQDRVSGEYTEELPYVSPPRSRFSRQGIRTSSVTGRRSGGTGDKFATPGPEFLR